MPIHFTYKPYTPPSSGGGIGPPGPQGPQGPQGPPGEGVGIYTNLVPTPSAVGGVTVGTTFNMNTVQQVFDQLFYPYQVPAFTSFSMVGQASTIEVGFSISGLHTFAWNTSNSSNIQPNSIQIKDNTANVILASGLNPTGSHAITLPSPVTNNLPGSHVWGVQGINTQDNLFSSTFTVNWRWRAFWGISTSPTLTASDIQALSSNQLSSSTTGTYSFGGGGYKYLCWPQSFADPAAFKDTVTNLNVAMCDQTDSPSYSNATSGGYNYALVSVTNSYGQSVNYKVFRSKNILSSNISIQVT